MRSCLPLLGMLSRALFAGALVVCLTNVVAADVVHPRIDSRVIRLRTSPFAPGMRYFIPRSAAAGNGWVIRDLGLPATAGIPTPYAINQHGDVALSVCSGGAGCDRLSPPSSTNAYVYDYRCARLIALTKLAGGSKPPPIDQYVPHALNDRGQIVGAVIRTVGMTTVSWPVLWTRYGFAGSTIVRLDTKPGDQGTAYAINNGGVAVGTVDGSAVRFTGGASVLLGTNAAENSDAFGINDSGVAVGDMFAGAAAVFAGGVGIPIPYQDQCPPSANLCDENTAVAINKGGTVLGDYVTNFFDMATPAFVGFSWNGSSFATLAPSCFDDDCPIQYGPFDSDYVLAENDGGDFVGYFDGQPWVSFSPVGDANGLLPAGSGWRIINVVAINNRRQMVGQGYRAGYGNTLRAFLLEPGH